MQNADKSFTVIVTPSARKMLIDHAYFLAQVSERAAERLVTEFEKKVQSLEMMAHRNPWVTDSRLSPHRYRKLLLEKRYLLIYQTKADKVYVHAVLDCRQQNDWLRLI